MKRSEVEAAVAEARDLFRTNGYTLPPFADWTAADWQAATGSHAVNARLGWDVTDYGQGRFDELGLTLFTVRNGLPDGSSPIIYAEKAMMSRVDQLSPMHRHLAKVEDIINRGGGTLVLELRPMGEDGMPDRTRGVSVLSDGRMVETAADGILRLGPGASVTLTTDIWHAFWAEGAPVFIGEVSATNDDETDNLFEDPLPRFPSLDEDTTATVPLVSDR